MKLSQSEAGKAYIVKSIMDGDEQMNSFLFSLGCYGGESVAVVSKKKRSLVLAIKNARYTIDDALADAIEVY